MSSSRTAQLATIFVSATTAQGDLSHTRLSWAINSLTEGDLIVGASHGSVIGTLVERSTRYVMLLHLRDGGNATAVRDTLISTLGTLPTQLRRSLTWDQGKELARHREFSLATDIAVYFCDPHSPWQRGSNENTVNVVARQG